MLPPNLAGVRLKIDRANHHLLEVCAAINSFYGPERQEDSMIVYPDIERKRVEFVIGEVQGVDPVWAAMIGDIVHNLRSALDHLVCQLALLNGNGVSCCNKTSFPVCIDPATFGKWSKRNKRLICADAFALIEELQPYNAANPVALKKVLLVPHSKMKNKLGAEKRKRIKKASASRA